MAAFELHEQPLIHWAEHSLAADEFVSSHLASLNERLAHDGLIEDVLSCLMVRHSSVMSCFSNQQSVQYLPEVR